MVKPWNLRNILFPNPGPQLEADNPEPGKMTRDVSNKHKQTHMGFMAGNNKKSDNFTETLDGYRYLSDFGWSWLPACVRKVFIPYHAPVPGGTDSTRNRKNSRCPLRAAMKRGVAPVSVLPWSLLAPDSTRNRTTSRCRFAAAKCRGVVPSFVFIWHGLVFVGTGLNQRSDNFKVPLVSSYEKRRCSIICRALVFVGTGLNQKSDNFKVPVRSC